MLVLFYFRFRLFIEFAEDFIKINLFQGRGAKYFTEYAEVKIEHYPKPYGTLPELKRLLQLARRSSVRLMDYFRKHFYIPSYFLMNFATRSYLRFLFSHMISNAVWFICGCVM